MKKSSLRSVILFGFLFLITPFVVFGQNTDDLCRAFISQAFRQLGSNCANVGFQEACYGYGNFGEVTSTFFVDGESRIVRDEMMAKPSERVSILSEGSIATLESLTTDVFVLDSDNDREEENRWGVALLEVPANLPRQLEQNTAVFVLFGGARVENAVYPEDALILPEEALSVIINNDSSVYGSPLGLGYTVPDVIVGAASGELQADGISPDGKWVRIFYRYEREFGERTTAWVKVEDLLKPHGLDTLPEIGADTKTAMQEFFLVNSLTTPICADVPAPALLIQGPSEIETDFTINNIPVRLTSTAYFRQIDERRLQITALTGFTVLFPDTEEEEVIPEGFSRVLCLTEELDLGIDEEVNDRELDRDCTETGLTTNLQLGAVEAFPDNLLNYAIILPTEFCPSGVGSVECQIIPNPESRIPELCAAGQLPPDVCERYRF